MHAKHFLKGTAIFAIGALGLSACSSGGAGGDTESEDGDIRIVMLLNDQFDPYYLTVVQGAEERGEELGIDFEWQAPTTLDVANQTALLKSVAATKPDGIVMSALDADAMVAPMKEVMDSGIPIVTVDSDVNDESARLGTVKSDGHAAGALAAKHAEEVTGGDGTVGYVGYTPGIQSVDIRLDGWREALGEVSGLRSVGEEYAGADVQENVDKASALIAREKDLDVIFASWTNAAIGTAQAVQQSGRDIAVIGLDAAPEEVDLLQRGLVEALIVQRPNDMGSIAVEELVEYITDGTEPESETLLDAVVATQENMDDPDIKQYFYVQTKTEE